MTAPRLPNLVELGRRPDTPRYVWIVVTKDGINSGAAWRSLERVLEKNKAKKFLVVDTKTGHSFVTKPKKFMPLWREHYFDPSWEFTDVIPVDKG